MYRLAACVVVFLTALPGAADDRITPESTLKLKTVSGVHPSPDGKQVAYVVRQAVTEGEKSEYLTHIHIANADGSDVFQLTQGEKSCDNPQWSPDGKWIAFTSARSGKSNLWLIRAAGGEARQISDVKSGVGGFKWSPDGKQIAFTAVDPQTPDEEKKAKEKNDARVVDEGLKMARLYVLPVEPEGTRKHAGRKLTTGNYSVATGFDWSPDSKTIAFAHTRTAKVDDWPTSDLSLVDVAKAETRPLVSTPAAETSPLYSPDGKWIAYIAGDNPPRWAQANTIHVIPAAGGSPRALAPTHDMGPRLIGWSKDSQSILFSEVHGTATRIQSRKLDGTTTDLFAQAGVVGSASLNHPATMIGFSFEATNKAPEAYVSALEPFGPVAVSRVNKGFAAGKLPNTEVIRWKSVDDREIEGLLTYPTGYQNGKRYPLLLIIHGGPAGVFTQNFTGGPGIYPLSVFASHGYATLRCNIRGSSGYGKDFRYANYGDWGGKDLQDLMKGVDHVIDMGVADADKLGVMGWSYGGFMTSWTITQTKRFKAASVGAGVTNLMSFTGTADIPSFLPDYFGGEFWDRFDAYRGHSAMFHVKGVTTPTLIQHGEKDDRVPISQGYELYNALKRQGCTVKMVVYPRTPHGPQEPKLLLDVMKRNVEWFDKYLATNGS